MGETIRTTRTLVITYYLITIHIAVLYLLADKIQSRYALVPVERSEGSLSPIVVSEHTDDKVRPDATVNVAPTGSPTSIIPIPNAAGLIIPVAGVTPAQLVNSFSDARSDGRLHDAIDIAAPADTPVLAAADGSIIKFLDSEAGGITIYQLSSDQRFVYYYAHLSRRAADIQVGDTVKQGRTIGYVGDTGNAGAGNYHLHFSIAAINDPKRYWEGTYIDPYPLLVR